jgi:hypothetical protein
MHPTFWMEAFRKNQVAGTLFWLRIQWATGFRLRAAPGINPESRYMESEEME